MKIVILDGHAVNPGDLNWDGIGAFGDLTVYEHTEAADTVSHIGDADIVLTNKTLISQEILRACPQIRYVGVLATGYNVVDLAETAARGITVTNVPAYSTTTVAQFTFGLILELCHQIGFHDASVKAGDWIRSPDFCYWKKPMIELEGKTLGIVGYGRIGRRVAQIAQAFGLFVLVSTPHPKPEEETQTLRFADLDTVLARSDFVSLHCPLNPATKGMINRESIAKMKTGARLINVARGPLVVEADLAEALRSGRLAGAACDVLCAEPMAADNPLMDAPNICLTPHIAWASIEARRRLLAIAEDNLRCYVLGRPVNVVS